MLDVSSRLRQRRTRQRAAGLAAFIATCALVAAFVQAPFGQAATAGSNPIGTMDSAAVAADGSIAVSGWAADADAPKTALRIDLTDNGVAKSWVAASTARADVGVAHPELGPNHGFSFRLVAGEGSHVVCTTAENAGPGASLSLGCKTVLVHNNPSGTMSAPSLSGNTATFTGTATDANSTKPVIVSANVDGKHATDVFATSGTYSISVSVSEGSHLVCLYLNNLGAGQNVRLGCPTVLVHNNPFGKLETAGQRPTGVTVSGYAIDPNTTAPVTVWTFVDGVVAAKTVASLARPDLATSYPSSGTDHGYSVLLPLATGSHRICVWAINLGPGVNLQLGCSTVVVQNNPIGNVESVGQVLTGVQVNGWAIDPNSTGAVTINLSVDGKHVSAVSAAAPRPSLLSHFPYAGANHGLSTVLNIAAGTHTVCADAVNIGLGVSTRLRCWNVTVRNNPIGSIDSAHQVPGGIRLDGWALDLNSASAVSVFLYVDGKYSTRVSAAVSRADLAAHYPTVGGGHGYSLIVAAGPGKHTVCAYAINIGLGTNSLLHCSILVLRDVPVGTVDTVRQQPGGLSLGGWAIDAFSTAPDTVRMYVDGRYTMATVASVSRPSLLSSYPNMGASHGFTAFVPVPAGKHTVCGYVINPRHATNLALRCSTFTRIVNPIGVSSGIARVGITNSISVSGWALDSDSAGTVTIRVTSDGKVLQNIPANVAYPSIATVWPAYGGNHGFSSNLTLNAGEHTVCTTAINIGQGISTVLGCAKILTSGEGAPAVPASVTAWAGSKSVTIGWVAPRSDNAPITSYQVKIIQRGTVITVGGSATGVVVPGLTNGVHYTFSVVAVNTFGPGSASLTGAIPTNIPPQVTPAPVSTSHYLRNLTGSTASDAALMRSMGATDASHDPSGHSYLVLLQVGGQDEINKGAILSATSRFVSYAGVVNAMKAYLDGYATRQLPYAPLTLAIGTNNDVDVSTSAGISWAHNVVNPVVAYAAAHHPGVVVAGANDMEPGFSATVAQSRAWLTGYLSATSTKFVFNGSADGCSTGVAGSGCNNGWRMADLQWVSGGASPTRTISLPQIYNYAMPQQWKYISLTGTNAGRPRINFGGPLTEATACGQAGSCGSISNVVAWAQLWSAISSSAATRQFQMPHGTDLRIN
jgi:hypothetical protein